MPVGQMIALGIGSPANITQLVLTGLIGSSIPGGTNVTSSIPSGQAVSLAGNTIYAIPPRIEMIEWLSSAANVMEGSLDQVTWTTLGTTTGNENKLISNVVVIWIRPQAACTVTLKKKKKL